MQIELILTSEIQLREKSQRRELSGIAELADSIRRNGLLHPITLDENMMLIAGGRRLAAHKLLEQKYPDENWQVIPAVFREELSDSAKKIMELEENMKRADLTWQEHCLAVLDLDGAIAETHQSWTQGQRAQYIGYHENYYSGLLRVARALLANDERASQAPTLTAALNIIQRADARKQDNTMNKLFDALAGGERSEAQQEAAAARAGNPAALSLPSGARRPELNPKEGSTFRVPAKPARAIFQADAVKWFSEYDGPRFNLIHCDFPYGIDHGKSAQGGAKSRWDAYEDGEDVYWTLIRAMLQNRDRFMSPSCHMIFWFSMKFYTETIAAFNSLAPELEVNYAPLIWHKTDNKGIIRDVEHTPRHVYETALFITRGNRQIIKAVGDCYGAPTRKSEALHISEKPVPVLRHFFELCVDVHSEVLDPTAGSGSAIRAAASMGAKRVLGLELNPEFAEQAQKEYENQAAIEMLRKKEDA